jgi:hypothetical protein
MVTTLGLLGLMNELRRSSIRSTPKRSNPYLNPLNQKVKVKNENSYCVCACEKYELCTGYECI